MTKVTGLEGVIAAETAIGHVDGQLGHLVYRGHWAKDLAVRLSFEEVAHLLWFGELPNTAQLQTLQARLAAERRLTPELMAMLDAMPKTTPLMSVMMATIAALADGREPSWPPTADQAIRMTALLPVIIAYRYHQQNGTPWPEQEAAAAPAQDRPQGHVAHYLRLLFGRKAAEVHVRALNAYMVLAMEHGLNASTFAARVVSSTESDFYSSVGAAIAAMKGPLHGGAPSGVITLLNEIGTKDRAEPIIRELLEKGEKLMGFGHRVYKTRDPRSDALRAVALELAGDDPWLDLAVHVEQTATRLLDEYKPGRKLYANVEFYAAAVMRTVQMPPELFTPTFTAARIVGWTAHVLEQSPINRIYRPQSIYVGPMPIDALQQK